MCIRDSFPTVWMESAARVEGSATIQVWLASNLETIFLVIGIFLIVPTVGYMVMFLAAVLCKFINRT